MNMLINAPSVTANEDTVLLTKWHRADGEFVTSGELICALETTKATVEIEAESDGYLTIVTPEGTKVDVGAPIAALTDKPGGDLTALLAPQTSDAPVKKATRKAEIVARKLGVDIDVLFEQKGGAVSEEDVRAAAQDGEPPAAPAPVSAPPVITGDLFEDMAGDNRPERLLLLGGGAGAGAMAIDILTRLPSQRASVILDGNKETHGKTVGGVPVIGGLDLAVELYEEGRFDKAVILFTQDVDERAEIFDGLRSKHIPFGNLIDPLVEIRGGSTLGHGNLIMANVFLSTSVTVGDNCFFASHCVIEHHSTVGDHCAFGPRTTTSGAVTIGERVKTGMGVCIEPYVTIGRHSLIASGSVITQDIPEGSLVKTKQTHAVQPRPSPVKAA